MGERPGGERHRLTVLSLRVVIWLSGSLLVGLYTAVTAVGALTTPLGTLLVLTPLSSLGAAGLYLWARQSLSHDRPRSDQVVNAAFAGASALPYVSGAQLLGVLGGPLTLTVLALAVAAIAGHLVAVGPFVVPGRRPATTSRRSPHSATGADEAALRLLLRRAPLQILFRRWHATGRTLSGTPSHRSYVMAVYLRGLLLDELHARDPTGARRWIDQGGAQPPERHIRSI